MDERLSKLVFGSDKIPTLPIMFKQINNIIDNPRTSLTDIGKIIEKDPGMTARLLKLANSAFYGLPKTVESITRALVIIGTKELRDFILGTTILSLFKGIPEDLVNMKSFWEHSVACGLTARIIATFRGDTNTDRLFVAGLLHDVGRLFIFKHLVDEARKLIMQCKSSGSLLFKEEIEEFEFDHAQVGHELLKRWNIPGNIQEMVAYHHDPIMAKTYPIEASTIHVADIIVHSMQIGSNGEKFVPPLDTRAWSLLQLQPSMISPIIDQMDRQFDEVLQSIYPE